MAEIKTGIFAKNVQKRLSRAQEKVLQKLGKADETKDEQFEQCVLNFKKQETEGFRLQREMKAYLTAVKGMQQASMNLTESLHEVYEPDWHGKDDVMTIGKNCDALWEDFHQKLVDSSLITLDTYLAQFPDIKNRVAKRSRKLIDYDSARHYVESLQASAIRNERKVAKAEEEFQKAQKVFDELNIDLQEELPSLWDSRVGFYVNTFKNVTNLESKFHREISMLCHKLYEVMTKLGEQHSDKMFTIQGAPSDSGPLRLARTPSPPEDESPPGSPEVAPNHSLRPTSPGPPRPKSPSQLKKGPPVPPPPKVTPTKELHQEQIVSLFDNSFSPEATPSQKEAAGGSLLDMDFDPFKPDATTPIGQTQSPLSQTLPWDLWTAPAAASSQPEQAAGTTWMADFGTPATASDTTENQADAPQDPFAGQGDGQGWPPADGWGSEVAPAATEEEVSDNAFNGFSQLDSRKPVTAGTSEGVSDAVPGVETPAPEMEVGPEPQPDTAQAAESPGAGEASPPGDKAADVPEAEAGEPPVSPEAEPTEETAQSVEAEKGSPPTETPTVAPGVEDEKDKAGAEDAETKEEKMPIPSVVIEPASSNEGDDDRDGDITSPSATSDNSVTPDGQAAKDIGSPTASDMPPGFLYKVETLHDFEAANSDELDLKRGDVVLVIPTALAEDQDAGWLTGMKESDWLQQGNKAPKGLFPENFSHRLE
ncbi:amphiphysin isoform X1 [Brienomyrus brachyistius]|uniref:amphiphysin isoform X1 n=1 Tax=Brienomyrus brachyistius TaxID=42636 RepID=UPI0020B1DB3B|nr:amphiphysin isoform X1 [Brienomyrus brachyistius]